MLYIGLDDNTITVHAKIVSCLFTVYKAALRLHVACLYVRLIVRTVVATELGNGKPRTLSLNVQTHLNILRICRFGLRSIYSDIDLTMVERS